VCVVCVCVGCVCVCGVWVCVVCGCVGCVCRDGRSIFIRKFMSCNVHILCEENTLFQLPNEISGRMFHMWQFCAPIWQFVVLLSNFSGIVICWNLIFNPENVNRTNFKFENMWDPLYSKLS